ncbi:MAG: hypothetical protein JNK23_04110 [Opitutaceae bacterium]|nr:hypothetical protein [Opitutaceae bacterium]
MQGLPAVQGDLAGASRSGRRHRRLSERFMVAVGRVHPSDDANVPAFSHAKFEYAVYASGFGTFFDASESCRCLCVPARHLPHEHDVAAGLRGNSEPAWHGPATSISIKASDDRLVALNVSQTRSRWLCADKAAGDLHILKE